MLSLSIKEKKDLTIGKPTGKPVLTFGKTFSTSRTVSDICSSIGSSRTSKREQLNSLFCQQDFAASKNDNAEKTIGSEIRTTASDCKIVKPL